MILQLWEIVDKATILKIKKEKGLPVGKQLDEWMAEAKKCDPELVRRTYEINKLMWDMEDHISKLFELNAWETSGKAYHYLRALTHERTAIKNEIAKRYDKYKELKWY